MPLNPGTHIGRYEVRSLLGQGGMGEVYRAADTSLGRDVALKVLDASVAVDPERVHRFLQEARAASALNHPNIIAIHEAGESDGVRFIASELVEGRTLRELLEKGPMPASEALDIAVQVASALAAAHAAGIVHRDVKPENIMLRPDGYAKVLDFGLAKLTDPAGSGAHPAPDAAATMLQTTAGVIMGTVAYMSPEQARALKVDARTDCYSLGAVIFEMLTGRQPFTGATSTDVMVAILERDAPLEILRREGLPPQLVWVLAKALEKNPDLRHQTAADLRVDLERVRRDIATGAVYADHEFVADAGMAIVPDLSDDDERVRRMYGFSRWTAAIVGAGVLAAAALPFVYRATLGSSLNPPIPEAAADFRARDLAGTLGHPQGANRTELEFVRELDLLAVRNLSPGLARQAVRDGHATSWRVGFMDDRSRPAGMVLLSPDGRLRSFQPTREPGGPPVTLTRERALERAAGLASQQLGVDTAGYTLAHAGPSPDGTRIDVNWRNPHSVLGHADTVTVSLSDERVEELARTLKANAADDPPRASRANQIRAAIGILAVTGFYALGILVLVKSRRWALLVRPLPVALTMSLAIGLILTGLQADNAIDEHAVMIAIGLLMAGATLPSIAGLVAWLRQSSPVRLHGAEQMAAGRARSIAVASSLAYGMPAGAVLAAAALAPQVFGLYLQDFRPSIGPEIDVISSTGLMFLGEWMITSAALVLSVALLFELPCRLLKRPAPGLVVSALAAGVLAIRFMPDRLLPLILLMSGTTLAAVILMVLYARRGFAAVWVAVLTMLVLPDLLTAVSMGQGKGATVVIAWALLAAGVAGAVWGHAARRTLRLSS